jgi:cytoskeletal protein CcmA (bactofilin family)
LRASGRAHGDVTAPSFVVQEGAVLNGQCSMGGADATAGGEHPEAATRNLDGARDAADGARDAAMEVASALSR